MESVALRSVGYSLVAEIVFVPFRLIKYISSLIYHVRLKYFFAARAPQL